MHLSRGPASLRLRLDLVSLGGFAGNYPGELSGGMQQRVGIATPGAMAAWGSCPAVRVAVRGPAGIQ